MHILKIILKKQFFSEKDKYSKYKFISTMHYAKLLKNYCFKFGIVQTFTDDRIRHFTLG